MIVIDPKHGLHFCNVRNLDEMYREIGCSCIDIVRRSIGGKIFDIICDDEGLLKDNPEPSAFYDINGNLEVGLVGNLIVCNHDEMGNTIDINFDDTLLVISRIKKLVVSHKDKESSMNYALLLDA